MSKSYLSATLAGLASLGSVALTRRYAEPINSSPNFNKPKMHAKRTNTTTAYIKKKKPRKGKISPKLVKDVQSIIRSKTEAAHHAVFDVAATTIFHGNVYTSSLLTEIPQGTNNAQRIGDEIFLEAIKVRFQIVTAPTTTTIAYRVMLVKSGIEKLAGSAGAITSATGIAPADLFFVTNPGGDANYASRGIVNPKQATVLYDKFIQFDTNYTTENVVQTVFDTIPLKTKHIYNSNSSYAKFKNIYWIITAYQNGGTTGTTNCGNIGMQTDIIFKNEA